MSAIIRIGESAEAKQVGELGAALTKVHRRGARVAAGFVVPRETRLTNGLSNEILREFDRLKTKQVVLRASTEDGVETESLRDIKRQALLGAVSYLQDNARRRGRQAAIIVQEQLFAEVSGRSYSINPATLDADEVLIEAQLWMNRTVLAGENETDLIVIRKTTGSVILESEDEGEICLEPRQVQEIYTLTRQVEREFGERISLDWAYDEGKLYVLRVKMINHDIITSFQQ